MKFSWDRAKNNANQTKHDLSFEETRELFRSGNYVEIFDTDHSDAEERFFAVGPIRRGLILVVWTEREEDEIRIISARFGNKREQRLYKLYMDKSK